MTTENMLSTAFMVQHPQEAIDMLVKHYHDSECIAGMIRDHFKEHFNNDIILSTLYSKEFKLNQLVMVKAMLQQNGLEPVYFYANHPDGLNTGYYKEAVEDQIEGCGKLAVRRSARFILIDDNLIGEPFLVHYYSDGDSDFESANLNTVYELVGYYEETYDGAVFHIIFTVPPKAPSMVEFDWADSLLKCWAISKSQLRLESMSIGHLALNIYNVTNDEDYMLCVEFAKKCFSIVQEIKADGKALSSVSLVPEYDTDSACLKPTALQLPTGSCIVIDERLMECGELSEKATKNIKALLTIATNQRLQYDFPYCPVDINVDYQVLVVSREKSLVPCHLRIDVESVRESMNAVGECRDYVEYCRSLPQPNINDETANLIEKECCKMGKLINEQLLHLLLTLSRILAISTGSVGLEHWHRACALLALPNALEDGKA